MISIFFLLFPFIMKLRLLNRCLSAIPLSTSTKLNMSNIFFKVPVIHAFVSKKAPVPMLRLWDKLCKNAHTHFHAEMSDTPLMLFLLFLLHQHFQYLHQTIYQLFFSCTGNFHSLTIYLHHMIYRIHTHNY